MVAGGAGGAQNGGHILEVELTGYAEGLHGGSESERETKATAKVFSLSHGKDAVAGP